MDLSFVQQVLFKLDRTRNKADSERKNTFCLFGKVVFKWKKSLLNAPRPFDFSLLLAGWPIFWIMNFVYLCWPITGYHMVEPPPWRWIQQTFFHHQTSFPNKLTIVLNISQCETHIFRVKLTVQRLDLEVHVHRRNPASVIFLYIKRWRMVIVIVHGSLIWRKVHDLPQAIVKLSMS